MPLQVISEGKTKLRSSNGNLIISQDQLPTFEIRPNKIIKNSKYFFCDSYTFKKEVLIPLFGCYFNGTGTAVVDILNKSYSLSGLSGGNIGYPEYIDQLINVLKQPEVSASFRQSSCKSNTTNSTALQSEQQACMTLVDFDASKYSLSVSAPTVNNKLTDVTATLSSPIGVALTDALKLTFSQSGVTSNVYYSIGVILSWAS